jgi:outer membrane protein assembly factor BamD (BamD/ComL family)
MIKTMSKGKDSSVDVLYLKANCERRLTKVPETIVTYQELLSKFPSSKYSASATYELALFAYKYGNYDLTVQYSQILLNNQE